MCEPAATGRQDRAGPPPFAGGGPSLPQAGSRGKESRNGLPVRCGHCRKKTLSLRNALAGITCEIIPDLRQVTCARPGEVKLRVPLVMQVGGTNCGQIASYIVLRALGLRVEPGELMGPGVRSEEGMTAAQVQSLLRRFGVGSSRLPARLTLEGLLQKIDRGEPVILAIGPHWAVGYGFSRSRRVIHLANARFVPGFSSATLSWRKFEAVWDREASGLAGWRWL